MNEVSYGKRLGAILLDIIILSPLSIIMYFSKLYPQWMILMSLLMLAFLFLYHVLLPVWTGGTPGHRLCRLRMVRIDGEPLQLFHALKRYAVIFFILLMLYSGDILALYRINPERLMFRSEIYSFRAGSMSLRDSLEAIARTESLFVHYEPGWNKILRFIYPICLWIELLIMMFNKKRRALRDVFAGTQWIHLTECKYH